MWERTKVGWHVAMYGLLATVAVSFVIDDGVSTRQRWIGLALVATLTVAYTVLARPVLGQERIGPAMAYIVVAWACFFCLMALHDSAFILLFALFPQVWALLPTRAAIVTTIVGITGLVVAQAAAAGWSTEAFVDAGVGGLVSLGISILLGLWITGVIRESDQRAALIAELERTRAELAAAEHDRGVLSERQRLAHEIHDTLAQGFASITALSQAAEAAIDSHPEAARDRILLVERTARDNLAEARALVSGLTPVDLAGGTLAEAVERLVDRFEREAGVAAEVRITGAPHSLGSATEVVMLRAAQEALTNVRRHAHAGRVLVHLTYHDDAAALEVSDDGRGFDPDHADGFGLSGMRSRVEQAGGELELAAGPDRGTTLRLRVPASVGAVE
ncbi:MAG TPA: sensor histidine kinase [Actinomycetes bacterium]|nr:sensor histidine kinase [Actinomycetes bacterium]